LFDWVGRFCINVGLDKFVSAFRFWILQ
jgi:hypothetical protein